MADLMNVPGTMGVVDPQALGINRQKMLAQMLMGQGQQPQGQMVGRFYVAPAASQRLSALASQLMGARAYGKATDSESQLATDRNQQMSDLINGGGSAPSAGAQQPPLIETWNKDAPASSGVQGAPQSDPQSSSAPSPVSAPAPQAESANAPLQRYTQHYKSLMTAYQLATSYGDTQRAAMIKDRLDAMKPQADRVTGNFGAFNPSSGEWVNMKDPAAVASEAGTLSAAKTAGEVANKPIEVTTANGAKVQMYPGQIPGLGAPPAAQPNSGYPAPAPRAPGSAVPGIGQSTADQAASAESGKNAGNIEKEINDNASHAYQVNRNLNHMKELRKDFTPGAFAGWQQAVAQYKVAAGIGTPQDQKFAAATEGVDKGMASLASNAIKEFTSRGTNLDLTTFLKSNPNLLLSPKGFDDIVNFMSQDAKMSLDKQQAFSKFKKAHAPSQYGEFPAAWNKQLADQQDAASKQPAAAPASPKNFTQSDLEHTAQKYGISVDEVKRRIGAK